MRLELLARLKIDGMTNLTGANAASEIEKLVGISNPKPFTREDLQRFREIIHGMGLASEKNVSARLSIELIDAIAVLDQSSTKLMRAANRLSVVMAVLTFAALALSGVQFYLAIWH
jgi:hypothetical protein